MTPLTNIPISLSSSKILTALERALGQPVRVLLDSQRMLAEAEYRIFVSIDVILRRIRAKEVMDDLRVRCEILILGVHVVVCVLRAGYAGLIRTLGRIAQEVG